MSKKKALLIVLAVVALLCVAGVVALFVYDRVDHSVAMGAGDVIQYNNAITAAARGYNAISSDEFVLLETVKKESSGHTEVTFRVYKLPEGKQLSDYLGLKVSDVPENFAPEYMGTGTARLVKGSLTNIVVNVTYYK